MNDAQRRELARQRTQAYRGRKRRGALLVPLEVEPQHLAALERLALLRVGDRDPGEVAGAVSRFLVAAGHIAALGDSLWPEEATGNAMI